MSFQLTLKAFWLAELISQFFFYSNCSKNITCPSGKLKAKFTGPIAKSTSPGLSDTTFFARSDYLIYYVILSETYQMLWQMTSNWSQPNLIDEKLKSIAA